MPPAQLKLSKDTLCRSQGIPLAIGWYPLDAPFLVSVSLVRTMISQQEQDEHIGRIVLSDRIKQCTCTSVLDYSLMVLIRGLDGCSVVDALA